MISDETAGFWIKPLAPNICQKLFDCFDKRGGIEYLETSDPKDDLCRLSALRQNLVCNGR